MLYKHIIIYHKVRESEKFSKQEIYHGHRCISVKWVEICDLLVQFKGQSPPTPNPSGWVGYFLTLTGLTETMYMYVRKETDFLKSVFPFFSRKNKNCIFECIHTSD